MKLHHRTPCAECPWSIDSMRGYLGGWDAQMYADAVAENEIPACHCRDFGPDDDETAFCVGALHTAANACILPWKQPGAAEARDAVGRSSRCWPHPSHFYSYHTGRSYVSRILRITREMP